MTHTHLTEHQVCLLPLWRFEPPPPPSESAAPEKASYSGATAPDFH
jgi:hypothetical protein